MNPGPIGVEVYADFWFFPEMADAAVTHFRRYYAEQGKIECRACPGIANALETLKRSGRNIMVATSKPTGFCIDTLRHLQMLDYFDDAVVSNLGGKKAGRVKSLHIVFAVII